MTSIGLLAQANNVCISVFVSRAKRVAAIAIQSDNCTSASAAVAVAMRHWTVSVSYATATDLLITRVGTLSYVAGTNLYEPYTVL